MLKNKAKNKQSGFTMIELLLALGVFTVGIMGAFTLSLSNIQVAKENYNRTLAGNLAREGIELIRNVRDTNWLEIDANVSGVDWDTGLENAFVINGWAIDYNDSVPTVVVGTCSDLEVCMNICVGNCELYKDADNFYNYETSATETNMSRIIQLRDICIIGSDLNTEYVSSAFDCQGDNKIGIQVTSRVFWPRNGQNQYLDVIEYLYNWRR